MAAVTSGTLVENQEFLGSRFSVKLDNGIDGEFTEVSGLGMTVEVVEANDSLSSSVSRKRPGRASYAEVTLKRYLTPDRKFWDWAKQIRDGADDFRTSGEVTIHGPKGDVKARWTLENTWPSKWSASDLDAGSDDPMVEEVTLQVEMLRREKV